MPQVSSKLKKSLNSGKLNETFIQYWLTVVCETKWNETKWDETKWKSVCNACGDLKTSENFNVSRVCKLSGLFYESPAKYQESRKTKWRVNGDLM